MNPTYIVYISNRGTGERAKLTFTSQEDLYPFLRGFEADLEEEDTKSFKEGRIYALQNYYPNEVKEEVWKVLPIHEILHATKTTRKNIS